MGLLLAPVSPGLQALLRVYLPLYAICVDESRAKLYTSIESGGIEGFERVIRLDVDNV
jgi:hypothetical protein